MERPSLTMIAKILLAGLLAGLILSIVILSCVPPVSRDALTHHLAIPKLYLRHGGIYEIPSLVFSYYPMNLDLIYLLPLYFKNDIIPKYIHFAFAILTAWLVFGYVKKKSETVFALISAFLFLSLPIIVKLSITVYVDLGLVFFSTAALIYLFKWAENAFRLKYLIISAVWCGLALGTKYNGLIVLLLLTLFVPFIYMRNTESAGHPKQGGRGISGYGHSSKSIGYAVIFLVIALCVFSPWAIRNSIWTGNPVYPLFDNWLNSGNGKSFAEASADSSGKSAEITVKSEKSYGNLVFRKIIYKETWWQTALIPVRIFFQGEDDNPQYFDGKLNPYLILLPAFAFLFNRKENHFLKTQKSILIAFSILYLFIAFFQSDLRMRYVAPILPPLAILSGLGLQNIFNGLKGRNIWYSGWMWKALVVVGLSLLIFMNAAYVAEQFQKIQPISYLDGRIGRDAYIEKYRPEYAAMQYANQNLPSTAKIFGLFLGDRGYYLERELFFGDIVFKGIITQADSAEHIAMAFNEREISHLLVRIRLFEQWSSGQFDDREKSLLDNFFKTHLKIIFAKGGYELYQLQN